MSGIEAYFRNFCLMEKSIIDTLDKVDDIINLSVYVQKNIRQGRFARAQQQMQSLIEAGYLIKIDLGALNE